MSKKWTEAQPGEQAIVDLKEFNHGYNAYKSTFNGGIDRTALPEDTLTNTAKVAGALHKIQVTNSLGMLKQNAQTVATDTSTGTVGEWRGPSYNTYGGGWLLVDTVTVSSFKDGMCHWEYKFHYLVDIYLGSTTSTNVKWIEVKLVWDGVEVAHSNRVANAIGTVRLVADFPMTGGNHVATVFVRGVPAGTGEVLSKNVFNIEGPSHLFIGRWR